MFVMADDSEWPKKKYANEQERKSHKPVLEKRRRQRINKSLEALKSLLLEAVKGDGAHHSKLEKADILEMTVRHLKEMQRKQLNVAMAVDPSVIRRYQSGFNECSAEVKRYLGTIDGIQPVIKTRLLDHLNNCGNSINNLSTHQSVGAAQPLLQTPLSPPLYTGQVIEVKPVQMSPEVTVIPYAAQPANIMHGCTHAHHIQHQQQNQHYHIINPQQSNQIHVVQQQQQHLVQTPVSSAFRQISPAPTPTNHQPLSPVFSSPSPHVSPIAASPTNQQVPVIDMSSPSFNHHRRQNKPEAAVSSPSFESDSFNSSNETTSTNSEIEHKQGSGDNYRNVQTLHETRHSGSTNFTNNNTESGIINTPAIQQAKIKSTKLFCHSTPKHRPLVEDNGVCFDHRQNPKSRHIEHSDNSDKENYPHFQLPSNGKLLQQDNMWRPW